jgi:uncharacterized protein YndB with AHSA1/START domain
MANIFHTFTIKVTAEKVFEGITTCKGLDNWWTKSSEASLELGGVYTLYFGPEYNWKAIVRKYDTSSVFELQFIDAEADWLGTKVGFLLTQKENKTTVEFYHTDWPELNEHFKISSYCWAMYLRILKRYLEFDEIVAYEKRLSV